MRSSTFLVLAAVLSGCTDAGLYAAGGAGPSGPDRAELTGTVCVPVAQGEAFPVKVLFALQGGAGQDRAVTGEIVDSVNAVIEQLTNPNTTFSVVAFHAIATGLQGSFVKDERLGSAMARYAAYQEAGPVSHRAPLRIANSILSGDMQTGCRGQVARTRYLVILLVTSADTSCANPLFNAGIDLKCSNFLPNEAQCSACELARVTEALKDVGKRFNAGEVTIQPVYIRQTADVTTRFQLAAIARAGGTELIESSPGSLLNTLKAINYGSLQRNLSLKRLVAMNRNVIVRRSQQYVDSDGDGVSDEQEAELGSNPTLPDSDLDGLGDGVELRMGMSLSERNQVKGCNTTDDGDGDRLNDCEERVLGSDSCISDTDGDGLPDLVEFLGNTNPLIAEDLADADKDGLSNVGEVEAHTDPQSADIAFQQERGYGYAITPGDTTPDGRACYDVTVYNVSVMGTLERPSPDGSGLVIRKGSNDIYLYLQVGRDNDPRGTGIGSLFVPRVRFTPPATRVPRGTITFTPDDFVSGY